MRVRSVTERVYRRVESKKKGDLWSIRVERETVNKKKKQPQDRQGGGTDFMRPPEGIGRIL
jgi:hypothetical protein